MKKRNVFKLISLVLVSLSIFIINPIQAKADEWKQNNIGWWYDCNNYWAIGWKQVDDSWYYFDNNGYMKIGWLNNNGVWYYLDSSGRMLSNTTININGIIYNFDTDGKWINNNTDDNKTTIFSDKEITVDYTSSLTDEEKQQLSVGHQYCTIFYNKYTFDIRSCGGGIQSMSALGKSNYYNNDDFEGLIVDALDYGMSKIELIDNMDNFEIKKIDGKIKLVRK